MKACLRFLIAICTFWLIMFGVQPKLSSVFAVDALVPERLLTLSTPEEVAGIASNYEKLAHFSPWQWIIPTCLLTLATTSHFLLYRRTHRLQIPSRTGSPPN